MVDLSKYISNKKKYIECSYNLSLQPNLLQNFVKSSIMLGLKNCSETQIFFKDKKIINFFNL